MRYWTITQFITSPGSPPIVISKKHNVLPVVLVTIWVIESVKSFDIVTEKTIKSYKRARNKVSEPLTQRDVNVFSKKTRQ